MSSSALTDFTGGAFPYRTRIALQRALSVIATTLVASLMAFALVMAFMIQAAKSAQPVARDLPAAALLFDRGSEVAPFEASALKRGAIDINRKVARRRL